MPGDECPHPLFYPGDFVAIVRPKGGQPGIMPFHVTVRARRGPEWLNVIVPAGTLGLVVQADHDFYSIDNKSWLKALAELALYVVLAGEQFYWVQGAALSRVGAP
jgi:hypothetical protein